MQVLILEEVDSLEEKAVQLSASHHVSSKKTAPGPRLVPCMIEHVQRLHVAYQECVTAKHQLSRGAQFFVDNFAALKPQLDQISVNLKPGYDDALPKLEHGTFAGYPRIYAIAQSIIKDTDGHLEAEMLEQYFRAYQRTSPLSITELLAVRAMLRLALIENLSQTTSRMVQAHEEERNIETCFRNLRWLATFDADKFFENVSVVESILRKDPAGAYSSMEPATRESYRRAIRSIASKTELQEPAIAQRAIDLASVASSSQPIDERRSHVGYHLIDDGRIALELILGYTPDKRERWSRALKSHPAFFYLGVLTFLSIITTALFISYAANLGTPALALVWLAVLVAVPVADVVLSALNAFLPSQPALLPKMDFSHGIPEQARTMVVVPSLISSEVVVQELLETIESHYLSNQDSNLYFALLTDWSDAAHESMPDDSALLNAAIDGIKTLNKRHSDGPHDRFYLFHRCRRWNENEEKWLGWERKRGKLHEFNQLLRGATDTSYMGVATESDFLARVRYVITLDADTLLPRGAARRLAGTISHPLNRPHLDVRTGRVVQGYGIIQPYITMLTPGAPRSSIPAILTNRFNVNAPAPLSSNTYQDLFGECNYVGKGLYDVDAFESALKNRIPENALLSHDLFEGLYARPAFASDIKLFDSPQSNYEAVAKRQHRWTRGDWQLWPWLLPRVPVEHGTARNVLPVIARWKIMENLRRSLVQPFLLLWLIASWTILPGSPVVWTLLVVSVVFAKLLFSIVPNFRVMLHQIPPGSHYQKLRYIVTATAKQCTALLVQLLLSIAYLAHQAYLMLDAITRTLYRSVVSGKRQLEWLTAAQVQRDAGLSLSSSQRYMLAAPVIAAICGVLVLNVRPESFSVAAPFLLAWLVSPFLAHYMNKHIRTRALGLELAVERGLRMSGRRMWQTLESFLGMKYEANKTPYITPLRSSPVNLARLLLWTRAAYELGSIGTMELARRLELGLAEIGKRARFNSNREELHAAMKSGPLTPAFILQAENGNLAGHLPTLTQFCGEVVQERLFDQRVLKGLVDTVSLMTDGLMRARLSSPPSSPAILVQLDEELKMCAWFLHLLEQKGPPQKYTEWRRVLNTLAQRAVIVEVTLYSLTEKHPAINIAELGAWTSSLAYQVDGLNSDLQLFAPWTSMGTAPLARLIRKYDELAHARWNRIVERLDRVPRISRLSETLDVVLIELTALADELDQLLPSNTSDRTNILDGCARLKRSIEGASQASDDLGSRYARLVNQSAAVIDNKTFTSLFDEEHNVLRTRFPNRLA